MHIFFILLALFNCISPVVANENSRISYFFRVYDTSYSKQAQTIDDKACEKIVELKKCAINNMVIFGKKRTSLKQYRYFVSCVLFKY